MPLSNPPAGPLVEVAVWSARPRFTNLTVWPSCNVMLSVPLGVRNAKSMTSTRIVSAPTSGSPPVPVVSPGTSPPEPSSPEPPATRRMAPLIWTGWKSQR